MNKDMLNLLNRIHIFCRNDMWICFDRGTNRILKLTEDEAVTLQHLMTYPNGEITPKQNLIFSELTELLGNSCTECRGLEPLNTFYLKINSRCNLQCAYCRAISKSKDSTDKQILTPELAAKAAAVMWNLGAKGVGLHGGDPLMDWDSTAAVLCAIRDAAPNLTMGLTCNGTLVTEEIARLLEKLDVRVSVELDGSQKIHDQFKRYGNGLSSYENAVSGAKLLRDHGVLAAIESTVSGVDGYDNGGYRRLVALFPEIPIVVARIKSRESSEWVCHERKLLSFLRQQSETVRQPEPIMNDAVAGLVNLYSQPSVSAYRCVCLLDKVSVDSDGSVYLCPKEETARTFIGNITEDDFEKEFDEKRLRAAQRFAAKPLAPVWYSALTEYCIDATCEDDAGQDRLQDEDILGLFFEDLIYLISQTDMSFLWEQWADSGF